MRWASIPLGLFLPPDYTTWWTLGPEGWPLDELAVAVLAPALLGGFAWLGRGPGKLVLFGLVWSVITLLPVLLLREVDLHRLGLIPAVGAAIAVAGALDGVTRRWPGIAGAAFLAALLALAPRAVSSGEAWGPGGFRFGELPYWQQSGGERWWGALTPQMQDLFRREVGADRAFLQWP